MKRLATLSLVVFLTLAACSPTSANGTAEGIDTPAPVEQNDTPQESNSNGTGVEGSSPISVPTNTPIPTSGPDCIQDDPHPIALSIAEQYNEITTYEQVMTWYCNGALFEDILNALSTQELSGADAGDLLLQISNGKSWNQIWLELGITEK
jgi:hypothetical protein